MSNNNYAPRPVPVVAAKESWLAYVLWILLGTIGIHKFYLQQNGMGVLYLGLGILGWATSWIFFVGFLFLIPLWIMMIIDLFTMPARVRAINSGMA